MPKNTWEMMASAGANFPVSFFNYPCILVVQHIEVTRKMGVGAIMMFSGVIVQVTITVQQTKRTWNISEGFSSGNVEYNNWGKCGESNLPVMSSSISISLAFNNMLSSSTGSL